MTLALETRSVVKTYKTPGRTVEALRGLDLEVEEGEFFALLGPNGAGKSTLIGILSGLVRKTAGEVKVFGHDLDRDTEEVKGCIGLVPQEFNFNIFETLINTIVFQAGYYGIEAGVAQVRAEKLLRDLELWEKRDQPARNLSGGMKRRLMLARALVTQPRLLILDEPTAGLDIELRRHLWDYLRELNRAGTTIILTTHYLEEAELLCRRVAIIDHGSILKNCPIRELLSELTTQTFVLDVAPGTPAPQEGSLTGLSKVEETSWEFELSEGQSLNLIFNELSGLGVEVRSMKNKTNRLEELFLRLVGNRA